jgi:hypothetical protein
VVMNTSKAWLHLEKMWNEQYQASRRGVVDEGVTLFGLCDSVVHLKWNGLITGKTAKGMLAALAKEPPRGGQNGWVWPRTVEGARQRALFCRQMAQATVRRTTRTKTKA